MDSCISELEQLAVFCKRFSELNGVACDYVMRITPGAYQRLELERHVDDRGIIQWWGISPGELLPNIRVALQTGLPADLILIRE